MGTSSDEQRRQRELQNARSQKSGYERERADKESTCRQSREKSSRVKTVKSNLETQKAVAKGRYQSLKDYAESGSQFTEWTGDKSTKTANEFNSTIVPGYDTYVDRIDEILDAVCDEITRLENENMQLNGDILHLGSLINSLVNTIEKLCN